MKILDELVYVQTAKAAYVGYATEDELVLHLHRAAKVLSDATSANELAMAYYCEKLKRNLAEYEIPLAALLEKRHDPGIARMVEVYKELSRQANKSAAGKRTMARLKKFLTGEFK